MATSTPTGIYGGVPADERRADRRERLLEAGLDALGTDGPQTTVRGICERARLNPRYFYESFSGLDELMVAVFDQVAAEAMKAVLAAVQEYGEDPEAAARATIRAFVGLMTEDPRKGRVAFVEAMGSEALIRRRLDTLQRFAELVAAYGRGLEGAGDVDEQTTQLFAQMMVGGLAEALIAWLEGRLEVSREQLVEHSSAMFIAAMQVAARPGV